MQADDFLKAYHVLAENYDKASLVIMTPSVVNLAFALELYIKDLHFAIKGKAPRGHSILQLYKSLPHHIKKEIIKHKAISQNPFHIRGNIFSPKFYSKDYSTYDRFADQIKAISKGFEDWRYSHENDNRLSYDSSFALALIEAIKATADSNRRHFQAKAVKGEDK